MSELSHSGAYRLIHKGQLTDAERFALSSHLQECAACRQHAIMAGVLGSQFVLEASSTRPSPQFTAVYMESAARRSRRSHIMKPIYAVSGAVALALLMLAGWLIIRSNIQTTGLVEAPELPAISVSEPQATAQPAAPEEPVPQPEVELQPEIDMAELDKNLIAAVVFEDAAEVAQLLEAGADPNGTDGHGNRPLPAAAGLGQLEIVWVLLEAGADVNSTADGRATDDDPFTQAPALLHAAASGHLDVVNLLLANGAYPNLAETSEGDVALHHAAWENFVEIVKALVDNGAEVDVRRTAPDGMTALHWAAIAGQLEATEALILAGADVNLQDLEWDRTPLLWVIYKAPADRQIDMTNLLLNAGAEVDAADDEGTTPLMIMIAGDLLTDTTSLITTVLDNGADPNLQDNNGDTALHHAARVGKLEAIPILIEHGADVNVQNNEGQTPLDVAENEQIADLLREAGATSGSQAETPTAEEKLLATVVTGDAAKVEQLLNSGANPNFVNSAGNTALPWAAGSGQLEIVQLLLDAGADVNSTMDFRVDSGQVLVQAPALIHASAGNHIEIVELLITHGADLDQTEKGFNETALHAAAWKNYMDIINLLLENGANPDAVGDYPGGETPLHYAVEAGSFEAAEALLDGGADVNVQIDQQSTPLIFITKLTKSDELNTSFITMLLGRGADPNIQDYEGNSALHYAVRESKKEAVVLLIEHGALVDLKNNEGQTALDIAPNDNIREILREAGSE